MTGDFIPMENNPGLHQAVDAVLMAFAAATEGASLGSVVANIYEDRLTAWAPDVPRDDIDAMQDAIAPEEVARRVAVQAGGILAEHLALEMLLLGAIVEHTRERPEQILRRVLQDAERP